MLCVSGDPQGKSPHETMKVSQLVSNCPLAWYRRMTLVICPICSPEVHIVVTNISPVSGLCAMEVGAYGPVVAKVLTQVPLGVNCSSELLLWLATRICSAAWSELAPSSTVKTAIETLLFIVVSSLCFPLLEDHVGWRKISRRRA